MEWQMPCVMCGKPIRHTEEFYPVSYKNDGVSYREIAHMECWFGRVINDRGRQYVLPWADCVEDHELPERESFIPGFTRYDLGR